MKCSLPIFAAAVLLAVAAPAPGQTAPLTSQSPGATATPAPVAAPRATTGDALFDRVLATVDAQTAIAAKLRHKVDLAGRSMLGSGLYLQQGRGPQRQFRLELKLQDGDHVLQLEEISNGVNLWLYEDLGESINFGRVDLARLARARPKTPGAIPADLSIMLGGLPKLLVGIKGSFRFANSVESRLDDLKVWTIEGSWTPARLTQMVPEQKGAIDAGAAVDLSKLAPAVPDRIVLHVGCDDFFPYRIEYWRATRGEEAKDGDRGRLLLVMEFYEVQLGAAIDPRQFVSTRTQPPAADRTIEFLARFGLEEVVVPGACAPCSAAPIACQPRRRSSFCMLRPVLPARNIVGRRASGFVSFDRVVLSSW